MVHQFNELTTLSGSPTALQGDWCRQKLTGEFGKNFQHHQVQLISFQVRGLASATIKSILQK
jgi:hypothetical protein